MSQIRESLSAVERATIIAALRFWVAKYSSDDEIAAFFEDYFQSVGIEPLMSYEIDDLCASLSNIPGSLSKASETLDDSLSKVPLSM